MSQGARRAITGKTLKRLIQPRKASLSRASSAPKDFTVNGLVDRLSERYRSRCKRHRPTRSGAVAISLLGSG